jgi:UPF0755 protein
VFAKTLEEHNENVARWREIEKKAARDANEDPAVPDAAKDPTAPANAQ